MGAAHDAAGGVVGIGQDQHLGPGVTAASSASAVRRKASSALVSRGTGTPPSHAGQRIIADKAGLRDQHLVPGIQHRPQTKINGLAAAYRDQDFLLRGVIDAGITLGETGDGFPQAQQSGVGRVPGAAFFLRNGCLPPGYARGGEIRFSHGQSDNVLHLAGDVENRRIPEGLEVGQRGLRKRSYEISV